MTEKTSTETAKSEAPHALRRLGQAIASLDEETPRIEVGDQTKIEAAEGELGADLPGELRQMYSDSNPVSLAVPMPADDIEFWPVDEIPRNNNSLGVPGEMVAFAAEGTTIYAVHREGRGPVFAGRLEGSDRRWEEIAASLSDFLSALAVIVETFASTEGDLASRLELDAQTELDLEEKLSLIDSERVDTWLEWLA